MLGAGVGPWRRALFERDFIPTLPEAGAGGSASAYNLGFARDYSYNRPFLNLAKLARYWTANNDADVTLDSEFYPTVMPAGASYLHSTLAIGSEETALLGQDIHILWDGDGVMDIGDGASAVTVREANRIVYTPTTGTHRFEITDLGTTGVRNVRIVRADHLDRLNAGERYNPTWFNIINRAQMLRFLNWYSINSNNRDINWADRPVLNRYSYIFRMPQEIGIEICNMAASDYWLQIPNRADQSFVEGAAALVRDTLNGALNCYVETSNEVWNTSFDQALYYIARGAEIWGQQGQGTVSIDQGDKTVNGTGTAFQTDLAGNPAVVAVDGQPIQISGSVNSDTTYEATHSARRDVVDQPFFYKNKGQAVSAYVYEATRNAKWWKAIHPDRSIHVLGAHTSSSTNVDELIAASEWKAEEDAGWQSPDGLAWEERHVTFDAIAVATYYSSNLLNSAIIAELNTAAATSDAAMLSVLDGYMRSGHSTSLGGLTSRLRDHYRSAKAAGLKLIAYEGGSHMIHPGGSYPAQDRNDLLAHFTTWVNSDICTAFHEDLLNVHKSFISGPFMQFDAVSGWSNTVAWGTYQTPEYAGDKRSEFIESLANAGRFWGDDIAPQVLQSLPDINGTELVDVGTIRLDVCFTADTATYSSPDLPAGLSLDAVTGDITGAPDAGAAGSGSYTVIATSAGGQTVDATASTNIAAHVPVDPLTIPDGRVYDLTDGANLSTTASPAAFGIASGASVAVIRNVGDAAGFDMIFDSGVTPTFNGDGVTWTDPAAFLSSNVPITNEARSMFMAARLTSDGGIVYGGSGGNGLRTYLSYTNAGVIGAASGGFGNDGRGDIFDTASVKDVNAVVGFVHDGVRNKVYLNGVLKVDLPADGTSGTSAINALGAFVGTSGVFLNTGFEGKIFAAVDVPGVASEALIYDITNWLTAKMN